MDRMQTATRLLTLILVTAAMQAGSPPARAESVDRDQVARQLVSDLAAGRNAEVFARFDDNMKAALPPEKLAAVWTGIVAQVGALQDEGTTRSQPVGPYVAVFVPCRFEHGTLDAKVVFDPAGRVAGLFFVPAAASPAAESGPARPQGVREIDVTVDAGGWPLPGTLTLPAVPGRKAAGVVLVHGSGPNDRDETIGPNRPFRDLAWGLAARGIVVLRYDKRTLVHGDRVAALPDLTVQQETVDDALAAAELLRGRTEVDPASVFVLGHSLGGMLAPRIAAADGKLAGLIILAGATRPLEDILVDQVRYVASLDGSLSEEEARRIAEVEAQRDQVRALRPGMDGPKTILGAPPSYWLDLRAYRPVETAASLHLPILILQGERDYQVTSEDLDGWKRGLSARPDVTIRALPGLNHLFLEGEGPSGPEEYGVAGKVDGEAIRIIADWLLRG